MTLRFRERKGKFYLGVLSVLSGALERREGSFEAGPVISFFRAVSC